MDKTQKASCPHCPRKDVSVVSGGKLRAHAANGKKITTENPACPGSGGPAGDGPTGDGPAAVHGYVCRVTAAEGCGMLVGLTGNGRARSHFMADDETRCPGGSDFPVKVLTDGTRIDTTPTGEQLPAASPEALQVGGAWLCGCEGLVWESFERMREAGHGMGDCKGIRTVLEADATAMQAPPSGEPFQSGTDPAPAGSQCAQTGPECQGAVEYARTPTHRRGAWLCTVHRSPQRPGGAQTAPGFDPQDPDGPGEEPSDPHARQAEIAIAEAERIQREQDAAYEQSLRDGMAESRKRIHDAVPLLNRSGAAEPSGCTHPDGFQDTVDVPDDDGQDTVVSVCWSCGTVAPDEDTAGEIRRIKTLPPEERAGFSVDALFDVTHDFEDPAARTYGVHPGEAADCRLPGCCTHPDGFTYGDDDNGYSGSFCPLCGAQEPEPENDPGPWLTPADVLDRMPEGVRRTAESNPECWDCGHEVTPRASRFAEDGRVTHVVWECSHSASTCHPHQDPETGWCRPQLPQETRIGELDEGECFMRHTLRPPLNRLVYRAQAPAMGPLMATVVGTGPYAGRTGPLTNLQEEITCTDQHGTPRPRRAPGTTVTSPSSPARPQPSTPSRPARTGPTAPPTSAPSSRPGTTASAPGRTAGSTGSSKRETTSGRARATTSTRSAGRTTQVPDAFTTAKAATKESDKYDSFGRYKLPDPDTGNAGKWTRATTFAKSVQDTYALSMWSQRMVLKGCALRSDIVAAAGTLDVKQDKDRMNSLVEEAKKAAGDKVAANKGTAMHAYTEDLDKAWAGEIVEQRAVPEDFVPSVQAYEAILRSFGLEPVPGLIEFTTVVKQFEVAGTSDRVYRVTRDITVKLNGRTVTLYAGEYVIGDVKTGADLSYGWQEICIQLALYCQGLNTAGVFDWSTGRWARPEADGQPGVQIKVRTDVGVVPHLPVDRSTTGAPLATLYAVDLQAGWAACVLCAQVRLWRKERKLATPLEVADVAAPEAGAEPAPAPVSRPQVASRPASLEDRARAVTSRAEASQVFQEAKAARVPVKELNRLTALMQDQLKSFVEQGA